jgi:dihydrofolate synthase/folylpolyglutamate synthase
MKPWELAKREAAARPFPILLGLDRVRAVLGAMQVRRAPVVIVVGGTNGKGSTCAMLDSILRAAGHRVGVYTSPHLISFHERIRMDGRCIDEARLEAAFAAVLRVPGARELTEFELDTLAAFHSLATESLDVWVLEIGLGGRLDAVNVLDADCSVITSIGVDHVEFLGPTREPIGFEKAHIYRSGRPAICSDPNPPESVIRVAAELGARLRVQGREFCAAVQTSGWDYRGDAWQWHGLPVPALGGARQIQNAAGVLAVLESLRDRCPVSEEAIRAGLTSVRLTGRFQKIAEAPAVYVDVAHNPEAAAVLAASIQGVERRGRVHAVFGILRDKDARGVLEAMRPVIDVWHVASTHGPRGLAAAGLVDELSRGATSTKPAVNAYDTVTTAYHAALKCAAPEDVVVSFGSFSVVSEVLQAAGIRPS